MAYTIEACGLVKAFGGTRVLDGLDLRVQAGSVFALLGPNGSGKTTTVRILSTLLAPDGGTARVAGRDVVREAKRVRAAISLTAQEAAVDGLLTGAENLRMMARLRRVPRGRLAALAAELLELTFAAAARATPRLSCSAGGSAKAPCTCRPTAAPPTSSACSTRWRSAASRPSGSCPAAPRSTTCSSR